MHVRPGDGELDALVGADGPPEDDPVLRILHRPVHEPAGVANALRGDQNPLGIEPVQQVGEPLAFPANQRAGIKAQVTDEQGVRLVVDHGLHGPDLDGVARLPHVDQEQAHPLGPPGDVLCPPGAGQQQQQVRVLDSGGEYFLAVETIAIAVAGRERGDPRRVAAGLRLGDGHRLQPQATGGDIGQVPALLGGGPVAQQRPHGVHLGVTGGGVAAGGVDLLQHEAGVDQAQAGAPVLRWDEHG